MKIKMNHTIKNIVVLLGVLTFAGSVFAQDAVERGKAKFDHTCAPCHAKGPGDDGRDMLPGTYALSIKYGDSLPAAIEDRTDLNSEVISVYVRMGTWSMPPFRKTELTDAEIDDIAAYLAMTSGKND